MMRIKKLVLLFASVLIMVGCSNTQVDSKYVKNQNNVDKVLKEQTGDETTEVEGGAVSSGSIEETEIIQETEIVEETENQGLSENQNIQNETGVDYDLTSMGSDMVYVTVYQFMVNPEDYTGKTVRMKGTYYATWYEPSAKYYHYCIIQDATACCAQGMEFVWGDGSHSYPDEYPEENTEIIVTGTFEAYYDEVDSYLYCRLKDAALEVVNQ